jgi:hypothetical protein
MVLYRVFQKCRRNFTEHDKIYAVLNKKSLKKCFCMSPEDKELQRLEQTHHVYVYSYYFKMGAWT